MSIDTTDTILALFGKAEVLILLLMAIDSGSAKKSDANLTSLDGILSIPGAFLEFRDFRIVLFSSVVILAPQLEEGIEMERDCKFPIFDYRFIKFVFRISREIKF